MPISQTQDEWNIDSIDFRHINPSIMEGEHLQSSLLGPRAAVLITRYAPTYINPPYLTGSTLIPSVITCNVGVVSSSPRSTYTFRWFLDGILLGGETSQTITTTLAMDGLELICEVTATNVVGSDTVLSAPLVPEIIEPVNLMSAGYNIITGLGQSGQINFMRTDTMILTGHSNNVRLDCENYKINIITGNGATDQNDAVELGLYAMMFPEVIEASETLLLNGNAESDMANWTTTLGVISSVASTDGGVVLPQEGTKFFACSNVALGTMYQDVIVPAANEADIDAGIVMCDARIWHCTWLSNDDGPQIRFEYFDIGDVSLGTYTAISNTPGKYNRWSAHQGPLGVMPVNTRKVRVYVDFVRNNSLYGNNAYLDNIKFRMLLNN